MDDKMLSVKLAFMLPVAEELEPFLAEFQTDKPMLLFLYAALDSLLRSLLGRIVKKQILCAADTSSKLLKINLEKPDNKALLQPLSKLGLPLRMSCERSPNHRSLLC